MERQLCQFQTVSTKGFTPGDRAKRVTGVIELEGIRDSELASNISGTRARVRSVRCGPSETSSKGRPNPLVAPTVFAEYS